MGELLNLVSVNSEHLEVLMTYFYHLWSGPLSLVISLLLLHTVLGQAVFAGKWFTKALLLSLVI
jgi:hypothetical protein